MRRLPALVLGLLAAFLPGSALAFSIPINFCQFGFKIGLSTKCMAGGAQGISDYMELYVVPTVGVLFLGVAVAMFFTYAVSILARSHDESAVQESKIAYIHAITGAAIVSLAVYFVWAVSPDPRIGPGPNIVNRPYLEHGFQNVIYYIKLVLGTAMIVNIVVQAARLIASQGEEDGTKAKQRLLYGFVGVAVILLANAMVTSAFPPFGADPGIITDELVGLANFLLALFALIAVLAVIVAGIMLIVSFDEGLKDKAKSIVKTAIITLAVIIASYAIVNAFVYLR